MTHREDIGSQIQTMRVQLGLSKEELAKMCGITELNVTKIENGVYNYPIDVVGKIADALNAKIVLDMKPEYTKLKYVRQKEDVVEKLHRWMLNRERVPLEEFMSAAKECPKWAITWERVGTEGSYYAIVKELSYSSF